MDKRNFAEEIGEFAVESTNVMTGGTDRNRFLIYQLKNSIKNAKSIDIMVSFLMESGVKMILNDLRSALDNGTKIRILTGNYLGITQPSALYLIKHQLGDNVDLRFYNEKNRSFHPKVYFFHSEECNEVYIGSSNLSKSALTSGIEWNYRFNDNVDQVGYKKFYDSFEELFENHSIVIDQDELANYSKNWHRPYVYKDLDRYEMNSDGAGAEGARKVVDLVEPRGAQIEALCALENSRHEGAKKGLVQAATGVGKTYIAAFDSREFERVLFVAHREEILKQAAQSFFAVRKSKNFGFFTGSQKDTDKDVVFASVACLGKEKYLNEDYFAPDYFDYIIIDEFHHAATNNYQNVVNYFRPKFLLGLTATPERMDGKNIYALCDYNVPFEISLRDAINRGMLVPFRYYGIYDDTDYSKLHLVKGKYNEKELNETYIGNVRRYDLIYKNYMKYGSKRALGFCCSRVHAEEMAKEFCARGIPAVAVYSGDEGEFAVDRAKAIEMLMSGEIRVIFSVDMFNEGVDIPSVDMVLFLRPTESPIVFLQQLGRGLRKFKGKEYLNVLDFIGNYSKAGMVRGFLGDFVVKDGDGESRVREFEYPDDCYIDFDLQLIDLFETMEKNRGNFKETLRAEFDRVEGLLEKRPTRMELFKYMDDAIYETCVGNSKLNPFKNYMEFLFGLGKLDDDELKLYNSIGREFLNMVETTNMVKVYKMPVLRAFYNDGDIRMEVDENQLLEAWKEFFDKDRNWRDVIYSGRKSDADKKISYEDYLGISDRSHLSNILKNPVKYLIKSGKGFFEERDDYPIAIRKDMEDIVKSECFAREFKDIIEYRTMEYYRKRYNFS